MTQDDETMNARAATTWEAPRWARVESFVKDQAMLLGLEYKTDVDKGLIRERGRVEVRGDADRCQEFMRRLSAAMDDYNGS